MLVGTIATPSYAEISEEQRVHVAERLKEATVTVLARQSSGSGFVVSAHGWIITNAHVASDARWSGRLRVRFGNGVTVAASLIVYDAQHDLAVAQAQREVRVRPLPLGDSDSNRCADQSGQLLALGSHPIRSMKDIETRLASHRPREQAIVTVTIGPGIVTGEDRGGVGTTACALNAPHLEKTA